MAERFRGSSPLKRLFEIQLVIESANKTHFGHFNEIAKNIRTNR